MDLTKNFTLEEMVASTVAKRSGIKNEPGETEIENLRRLCKEILQPVRDRLGKPIRVTSGYRCASLNLAVGGVSTSQHLKGEAADIVSENNLKLWQLITDMISKGEITVGQLINEHNLSWIHISLPGKWRNQCIHAFSN